MQKYNAVFYSEDTGYVKIVCLGYSKQEHQPFSGYSTVEEAKEQYSDKMEFIGIEWL